METSASMRLAAQIMIVLSAVCFITGNRGNIWFLSGSVVWFVASLVFIASDLLAAEERRRRDKIL